MTLDELTAMRDKARAQMNIRTGTTSVHITVSTSGDADASGARDVLRAILQETARRGLYDADVMIKGETQMVGKEPIVEILELGRERSVFAGVSPDDVPRILNEALSSADSVE